MTPVRPLRYGLLTGGLVIVACAVVGATNLAGYLGARAQLAPLTAHAVGVVAGQESDATLVRWTPGNGMPRTDAVPLATDLPPVGTRVEIAYSPAAPERLVVPGATVLAGLDGATSGLAFVVAALTVLATSALWQLGTRAAALRRAGTGTVSGRRVRIQRGTTSRSFLELDDGRWLPVHFDPALTALPTPATVEVHGDRGTHLAATVAGPDGPVRLAPAGRVRRTEPPGRRTDNPTAPDADTLAGLGNYGVARRLRADLGPVVVAPLLGLLWVLLVGGGVLTWLAATALATAGALHLAALRGSDPSCSGRRPPRRRRLDPGSQSRPVCRTADQRSRFSRRSGTGSDGSGLPAGCAHRAARRGGIRACDRAGRVRGRAPHQSDWARIAELTDTYTDLPLGLVDASVITAAERIGVTRIATLDHRHFSVVRPRHIESFTLVP